MKSCHVSGVGSIGEIGWIRINGGEGVNKLKLFCMVAIIRVIIVNTVD